MEKILLITGGSKGLGLALAKEYHKNGYRVISIARSKVKKLYEVEQYTCDLSTIESITPIIDEIFSHLSSETTKTITLINNAADLGVINQLHNLNPAEISYTIQLNLTAPLVLNSLFIKKTQSWEAKKKIINISSGAAVNPYGSWSMYCASKAGIDMMTKVIAKEQKKIKNGVKVYSIYPGIVDTDMQYAARNSSKEKFNSVKRFIDFYEKGQLSSPEEVATKVYNLDHSKKLKKGTIADVRNFK